MQLSTIAPQVNKQNETLISHSQSVNKYFQASRGLARGWARVALATPGI